jgi:SP family general alpha glucoside:H+ symporter-like MFS transporter
MLVSLFAVICFIFILFFTKSLAALQVEELISGIPWGVFQTLTTAYASEVCVPICDLRQSLLGYGSVRWIRGLAIYDSENR